MSNPTSNKHTKKASLNSTPSILEFFKKKTSTDLSSSSNESQSIINLQASNATFINTCHSINSTLPSNHSPLQEKSPQVIVPSLDVPPLKNESEHTSASNLIKRKRLNEKDEIKPFSSFFKAPTLSTSHENKNSKLLGTFESSTTNFINKKIRLGISEPFDMIPKETQDTSFTSSSSSLLNKLKEDLKDALSIPTIPLTEETSEVNDIKTENLSTSIAVPYLVNNGRVTPTSSQSIPVSQFHTLNIADDKDPENKNENEHENENEDDFWDQFESELCHAVTASNLDASTTASVSTTKPTPKLRVARYIVLFAGPAPSHPNEPLLLHVFYKTQRLQLKLYSPWCDLTYQPGDVVHVIKTNPFVSHPSSTTLSMTSTLSTTNTGATIFSTESNQEFFPPTIINANQHFLILHPDTLVTGSTVSDSHECLRRSILKSWARVKETNVALVLGTLSHDFLQRLLFNNIPEIPKVPSSDLLTKLIEEVLEHYKLDLHLLNHSLDQAKEQLELVYQHYISTLYPTFVLSSTLSLPTNKDPSHAFKKKEPTIPFPIEQIVDIEENIWAPSFGLKGKLDATLKLRVSPTEHALVPMEIKAGKKRSISHHAQTAFYTLLLAEKYPLNERLDLGLLFNVTTNDFWTVKAKHAELRDLIMLRNQYASALNSRFQLPSMLRRPSTCERCYSKTLCWIHHKAIEKGNDETANVNADLFQQETGHLTPHHLAFLKAWTQLINLEASYNSTIPSNAKPWLHPSSSSAWSHLTLSTFTPPSTDFDQLFIVTFQSKETMNQNYSEPLVNAFQLGDLVNISQMGGPYCISLGFVHSIDPPFISVKLDRPFRPISDRAKYQLDLATSSSDTMMTSMRYHLFSMFLQRENIFRDWVVDLKPPRFHTSPLAEMLEGPPEALEVLNQSRSILNESQNTILDRVMCMQDYFLVVGMPGTGKSTVLSHVLAWLIKMKKKVLLTSHTHSAIDTVLLKLHAFDPSLLFLRLGPLDRIHSNLHSFTLPQLNLDQLPNYYLFAATALGIQHPILSQEQFDYCIVDEATQIMLPLSLGPIQLAKHFILVGDPYQLPPVVRHPGAKGLEVSLFDRLFQAHPFAASTLTIQYRMDTPIMELANTFVYHHFLSSAKPPSKTLSYPTSSCSSSSLPFVEALFTQPILFLNTSSPETPCDSGIYNQGQIDLLEQLVPLFPSNLMSILTPYRAQLARLEKAFPFIEVCTIDQYQGRDQEIIFLSLVRCNEQGHVGDLLRDWKRINVAITRARSKLVFLGCAKTLSHSLLWEEIITYLRSHSYFVTT